MIHPTAIVHPQAQLHPTVKVGPYCTVGPQVKIGARTELISHVVVDGNTQLGEDNQIFPFAVLGGIPQDLKYKGENTQLIIGNRNRIRESATLNLGTAQGGGVTTLGDDNLLMAYVHLGHDSRIGNHVILANSVSIAGHVVVEDYATIGGISGVIQFVRVGAHSYTGGHSAIEKDLPPYVIAVGSRPCVIRGANIVGMRRRGFAPEVIMKINESIKLWTRPDVPKEQCLLEIESQYGEQAEVKSFIEFIRSSEIGVTR